MPFNKYNYINVGPQGTFKESGNFSTTPTDIDAIFTHIEAQEIDRLVLYFHGGLVNEKNGMAAAENITNHLGNKHILPVSFVWETGLGETVKQNLQTIHKTALFKKILKYVVKKALDKLGLDAAGRGTINISETEVQQEIKKEEPFEKYDPRARGGAAIIQESDLPFLENEIQEELAEEISFDEDLDELLKNEAPQTELFDKAHLDYAKRKGAISLSFSITKIIIRVIRRYIKGRHHDVYPTCVEEILKEYYIADFGKWVWDNIKNVAQDGLWKSNSDIINSHSFPGTYFISKLNEFTKNKTITIDLIGHSAGSIAICDLLSTIEKYPNLNIRHIFFLAPACNILQFHREVVLNQQRYQSFRLFTMSDDYEKKDHMIPIIYTRSLLYLISGILEQEVDTPILGMERFLMGNPPFDTIDYLKEVNAFLSKKNRTVFSVSLPSAPLGSRSEAQKHGDFDDDVATLTSIAHLIS